MASRSDRPPGQRHDPLGRHAHELGVSAPMAGAQLVAGDEHFVAGSIIGRRAFRHRARAIDARHVRKRANDARMPLSRQCVLVVERRVGDANQHVAGRQIVQRDLLDAGRELAVGILADHERGERLACRNRCRFRLGTDTEPEPHIGGRCPPYCRFSLRSAARRSSRPG